MAVLKLIKGGQVGQTIPLVGERTILGRHPGCQIVLDNAAISRQHAQVLETHGTYFVEDLRSRNGTKVNDETIKDRRELKDGDELQLCDFSFIFQANSTPTPSVGRSHRPTKKRLPPGAAGKETVEEEEEEDGDRPDNSPVDVDDLEGSSIITSLETESVRTVRLNVRPEVKLRAMLQISAALGGVLKLDDVLPGILDALFRIFAQADFGFLLLKDQTTGRTTVRASRSRLADDELDVPLSMTIVKQAMDGGKSILSADAARDRRFSQAESLADLQIRSVMCAPLMNQTGVALGVIQVSTRDLSQQFSPEDLELLASVSTQCALAVENATLHDSLLAQRDMDRELEFATQVQLGFLPSHPPDTHGYEFSDYYEPANRVGGDYFDYVKLPSGQVAITIGDVAGKGVPAALLMARLHASARYHLLSATSAAEALTSLNAEIVSSGLGFRFITLAMLVIDPLRHELHIANAGHLPPLLRNRQGQVETLGLKESGMPLGISSSQSYQEVTVSLDVGDAVLLYTDGVTEAMNPRQEIYGRPRLIKVFSEGPASVAELVPHVVQDVEAYYADGVQRDDLCIVAFRRIETPSSASTQNLPVPDLQD